MFVVYVRRVGKGERILYTYHLREISKLLLPSFTVGVYCIFFTCTSLSLSRSLAIREDWNREETRGKKNL